MNYLLDTHVFIWMDGDSRQLTDEVQDIVSDPGNTLILSIVSIWEMQIKHQLGKLDLRLPLSKIISEQEQNGILLLPVYLTHIYGLDQLPLHHRDPFDRLLIAQAQVEGHTLVSSDRRFSDYGIALKWE